jgi:HAMP domain-containing protein
MAHWYHHLTLDQKIDLILKQQEFVMAALDNLTAAEANLETVIAAAVTDIQTLAAEVAAGNTANDPAIQGVADKINAVAASLQAVVSPPAA